MKTWTSTLKPAIGVALIMSALGSQAAVQLNLTTSPNPDPSWTGPTGTGQITGSNGVVGTYTRTDQQPTGSGVIDPFVRVGMNSGASKDGVHAYNTTVDGTLNNGQDDTFNHEVRIGDMQIQTVGGSSYFRFLLDINQIASKDGSFISLDDVQIFVSSLPNQGHQNFSAVDGGLLALTASELVYRMDATNSSSAILQDCNRNGRECGVSTTPDGSNRVLLDYKLNSGSGSGDMYLDISSDAFAAALERAGFTTANRNEAFVYLYSKFGSDPYNNNDGFEEWAFLGATNGGGGFPGNGNGNGGGGGGVPEPSSLLLAGLGVLALRMAGKRRRATA